MFELFLIGGGLLLIVIAIIMAFLPVASYIPIPVIGDILDVPISILVALLGVVLITIGLLLGGLGYFLSEFWWVVPLALAVWFVVIWLIGAGKKALKSR